METKTANVDELIKLTQDVLRSRAQVRASLDYKKRVVSIAPGSIRRFAWDCAAALRAWHEANK